MYYIVNFATWSESDSIFAIRLQTEPDSVTVASLHCSLMMNYASFTINVVYYSVP